jgi:hypothetical protein
MRAPLRLALGAAMSLIALGMAAPARADIFSPGPLSQPHAALEGLANCTKCHEAGEQLSAKACLECHKELAASVQQGRGFHGRMKPEERTCQTCHHEHQGRDFKQVDWGAAGQKGFDHAKTGYLLEGKHQKAACARCHDRRLIADPQVHAVIEKGRASFLGAPRACFACHVDEHRGQLGPTGEDCARCHGLVTWKPARFDHAKAAYKLTGKHAKVACVKCHPEQPTAAATVEPGAKVPLVRPALAVLYKPVPFQQCTDCHKKDPHQGRFGEACQTCHVPDDWKSLRGAAKAAAFHEKSRYPLRGAHVQAKCEACHGPWAGQKAVFRGLKFERCTDCHWDVHLGQLKAPQAPGAPATQTCDRCHGVEGFLPARFEVEDHQHLAYRLEGAHRTVACQACHPRDQRLEGKVPAPVRAHLEQQRRPVKPSLALLAIPKAPKDCRSCHRDPHAGQFQARQDKEGCTACHGAESWKQVRFDHQKDSRYKLEGKHEKAACASCHRAAEGGVVRYRPLPLACAGCHPDIHVGQLAVKGVTDCARCHDAASWKEKLRFDHQRDSRYKLEGKHRPVACAKCHPMVTVAKGVETRRYKPLPVDCERCHADFHQGAFRGFKP